MCSKAAPSHCGKCGVFQRLPGGIVSNVIPLDLLQADGACERLHYCAKECQIKHWHGGHKLKCGKLTVEEYIRLYVSTMDIGIKKSIVEFIFRTTKYPLWSLSQAPSGCSKSTVSAFETSPTGSRCSPFSNIDMTGLKENQKTDQKLFSRKVQNFTGAECIYSNSQRCYYYRELYSKKWIFEPNYAKLFKDFIEHQKFIKKAGKSCMCDISKEFCMIGLKI
jgi:hypothetical protein